MAVTLHDGGAGNLKAVANGRRDRLRLAREGKPSDRLAICECEYPHLSMTEGGRMRRADYESGNDWRT